MKEHGERKNKTKGKKGEEEKRYYIENRQVQTECLFLHLAGCIFPPFA